MFFPLCRFLTYLLVIAKGNVFPVLASGNMTFIEIESNDEEQYSDDDGDEDGNNFKVVSKTQKS